MTAISLKDENEIATMRRAGQVVAQVLDHAAQLIRPGLTLLELERAAHQLIIQHRAQPTFLGYKGFPAAVCISLNDEVVHGIPNQRAIASGDLVKLDVGVTLNGLIADAARTYIVGTIPAPVRQLVTTTEQALYQGIAQARPGNRLHDISHAIQHHVEARGFSVVRALTGHGVGHDLHEGPSIPNFGRPGTGIRLKPGMTLAIEPMTNLGSYQVRTDPNGWTVRTTDHSPSAHFEHTVLITDGPAQLLTQ
jgi:methionyl aminopeptidase